MQLQVEAGIRRADPLQWLFVIALNEGGAQALMARHDALQRPLHRRAIQLATQAQTDRHVVGRAGAFHLGEEPQTLLAERQWPGLIACHRHDIRQDAASCLGDGQRQCTQFGVGKQRGQAQFDAQLLANLRNQAHRQQ